ncbi:hypothetical protein SAMN04489738_0711 [Pseudarthrobacter chlorophenolicus]|nr:hypothetical protein SAMN04489738_0711 [Pseudarthrobacter chlorophenolicus]
MWRGFCVPPHTWPSMNPMHLDDETEPTAEERKADLETGFQFVLTHDAELLKRLEDA